VSGSLTRATPRSFQKDYWSQPRLFFNSLVPEEQQFLINAIRFETSHIKSSTVKHNIVNQLNRIHHRIGKEVAEALAMTEPPWDPVHYHDQKTSGVGVFGSPLLKLAGLKVGVLTSVDSVDTSTIQRLKSELTRHGVSVIAMGESLRQGIDQIYSASDAVDFDAIVVGSGSNHIMSSAIKSRSTLYPAGRPLQILLDAYRYGKPVAFAGDSSAGALSTSQIPPGPGVYVENVSRARFSNVTFSNSTLRRRDEAARDIASLIKDGLRTFRFLSRFTVER